MDKNSLTRQIRYTEASVERVSSKYPLLRYRPAKAEELVDGAWTYRRCIGFNQAYIRKIRSYQAGNKYAVAEDNLYFLIWNLECMGKAKLAELIYFYMFEKGIVDIFS